MFTIFTCIRASGVFKRKKEIEKYLEIEGKKIKKKYRNFDHMQQFMLWVIIVTYHLNLE